MKPHFFRRSGKLTDIYPIPGIGLRLSGIPYSKIFDHVGFWRKTACFATLNSTILGNPSLFEDLPPVSFIWSEKRPLVDRRLPIYCEHGWMPRDTYQISAMGCNQHHPVAGMLRGSDIKISEITPLEFQKIERLRLGFSPPFPPADLCASPFFVFALQTTSDLNLQRCGLDLAKAADKKDGGKILLQLLSGILAECNPNIRVLFLQHPRESASFSTVKLSCPNHEYVPKKRKLRCHDLAMSPACKGVISINSNAINEAILFSRPVFQIGDFLMHKFPNLLFPYSLREFMEQPERCYQLSNPDGYLAMLLRNQYSLADLADPITVRNLILKEVEPKSLRE